MSKKLTCGNCRELVDFQVYDLKMADGTLKKDSVALMDNGGYLCVECMKAAHTGTIQVAINVVTANEFIASKQIHALVSMLIGAEDLLLQAKRFDLGADLELVLGIDNWISDFRRMREAATGESPGVH